MMFKERDTRMVTQKKGKLKDYAKMKKMKEDAKNSAKSFLFFPSFWTLIAFVMNCMYASRFYKNFCFVKIKIRKYSSTKANMK